MASLPANSIYHFTHPGHPLKPFDLQKFSCNGCKTIGTGKRYRCDLCNFDLHEYCATCPHTLSTFMHTKHALTLTRQMDRVCDVCADPVEGLFYRCKKCEFNVHPLCTQLPQNLRHALHTIHPLNLQSSSVSSFCAVCRGLCKNWRYRCGTCNNFDIHLECVLVPVVPCTGNAQTSTQRGIPKFGQGIPFQPPPQFLPYYNYGFPYAPAGANYPSGYGFNMYHCQNMYPNPNNFVPQNQQGGVSNNATGEMAGGRLGKLMFSLVGQLGFGVLSDMIFGVDLTSVFSG
ncbi:hypothetical protein BUALT_Bualt09G0117100 [Buddleja alternifolia]|uniref:DC1 domain-containing protein n=1 Tax=Buddleja alternifolia TaxID=168488 RepID=A0AAV6X395_9LAMI|nr:hypothetical protein BUALT_Bualt09G0117100 [Buddleja alternifolia]